MRSRLFIGALLVAVALTAGAAEAQTSVDKFSGNIGRNVTKVFSVTTSDSIIIDAVMQSIKKSSDLDIVVINRSIEDLERRARLVEDEDGNEIIPDNAIAASLSLVEGLEKATISVAGNTEVLVCVWNNSAATKYLLNFFTWASGGIDQGGFRTTGGFTVTEVGEFGPGQAPQGAGMEIVQDIVERQMRAKAH